jgi:hypothetical protein
MAPCAPSTTRSCSRLKTNTGGMQVVARLSGLIEDALHQSSTERAHSGYRLRYRRQS